MVTGYRYSKLERRKTLTVLLALIAFVVFTLMSFSTKSNHLNDVSILSHPSSLPYGESDDLRIGKSCVYNKNIAGKWAGIDNYWICQECSPSNVEGGVDCTPMKRRGRCRPFPRYLDSGSSHEIPRVQTTYSERTKQKSVVEIWTFDGHTEFAKHDVPICSATLSLPCFDLSRCRNSFGGGGGPISVFSHGGVIDGLLDSAATQHPDSVRRVHNSSEACLSVVGSNAYKTPSDLMESPDWNNGQNHYVFEAQNMFLFNSHGDRPFNDRFHFGMASLSRSAIDDEYLREGYDVPIALVPKWKPPQDYKQSWHVHRPKKYLLSFKGNIMPWEQRSWQHRWIAAEYWHAEEGTDVHVDTKCEISPQVWADYENANASDYGNLILNSTFFFCPGGGGVHSFRFAESLLGGAIPVVTSDFVPPFHPEIDWSGCIVQVSEARVVDIPRVVREIAHEEVMKRQLRCAALADATFGINPIQQMFTTAMLIWHARVKGALQRQDAVASLNLS